MGFSSFNPYWWINSRTFRTCTTNILRTNAVELGDDTVNYGVNPYFYSLLPDIAVVLLEIKESVPSGGDDYNVVIYVPNCNNTTLGESKTIAVPLLDTDGNNVTGSTVTVGTPKLVYINKKDNIIRYL